MYRTKPSWLSAVLLLLILLTAQVGISGAQEQESQTTPTAIPTPLATDPTNEAIQQEVERATNQVSNLLNVINTFAAILGAVGVVIAVVAAVSAYSGFLTNRDLRKQIDEARELVNKAEKIESDMKTIESIKSELITMRDDLVKSKKDITDEVLGRSQNITQAIGLTVMAQRQIGIGNLDSAVALLEQACQLDGNIAVTNYSLGDVYVRMGNLEKGVEYLKKARQTDAPFYSADASYAYTLRLRGDHTEGNERETFYAQATDIFIRVHASEPRLLDAGGESVFGALGGLYRRQERWRDAIKWYEHAKSVTPNSSYPVNNLAVLYLRINQPDKAREYFEEAREMAEERIKNRRSDFWAWFDLVTAKIALGATFKDIQPSLDRILKMNPGSNPLKKFLDLLRDLQAASKSLPGLQETIDYVQAQLQSQPGSI